MTTKTHNIPKAWESEEILCHYTSMDIAVQDILYNNTLKLSKRKSSNDPFEKPPKLIPISGGSGSWNEKLGQYDELNILEADRVELRNYILDMHHQMHQICFCQNSKEERFQNYTTKPLEYWGFIRPRMWDQYGDKYKGCCLIFSKEKLLKAAREQYENIEGNEVKYHSYSFLETAYSNIDKRLFQEEGMRKYKQTVKNREMNYMLRKHIDYEGENEFRIYDQFKADKIDKDIFFNYNDALIGICYSENYISPFYLDFFEKFNKDVHLLKLNWRVNGLTIN
jgi:hypothetical protein